MLLNADFLKLPNCHCH